MGNDESLLSLKRNQKLVGVEPGFPDAVTTADSGAGSETRHLHQQKKGPRGEDRVHREENAKNKNQQTDRHTDGRRDCLSPHLRDNRLGSFRNSSAAVFEHSSGMTERQSSFWIPAPEVPFVPRSTRGQSMDVQSLLVPSGEESVIELGERDEGAKRPIARHTSSAWAAITNKSTGTPDVRMADLYECRTSLPCWRCASRLSNTNGATTWVITKNESRERKRKELVHVSDSQSTALQVSQMREQRGLSQQRYHMELWRPQRVPQHPGAAAGRNARQSTTCTVSPRDKK
jgi:hypothetical protein